MEVNMLNLIICEDEEFMRNQLANHISNISIKLDTRITTVLSTDNPIEVYNYLRNNDADILILDIDLKNKKMDGIKLGEKLREFNTNIIIIFISARIEKTWEAFVCMPLNFIPKLSIIPQLEETFERIIKNKVHIPHGNFIQIQNKTINLNEIIYIEKQAMKSIFHFNYHTTEIYISFIQLLDCLTGNFLQVSKSFIINTAYISDINHSNKIITMINNNKIKYSKNYLKNMEDLNAKTDTITHN